MNTWGGENPYITTMQNNSIGNNSIINFGYGYNDPYAMPFYPQQQFSYGYDDYGNECCYDSYGNQYYLDQNGQPYYFDLYGNMRYDIPQPNMMMNNGWNWNMNQQQSDWDYDNYSQYGNDIGNQYICGYDPGFGYTTPGHNEFGFSTIDPYEENRNKIIKVSYEDRFKPNKGFTVMDRNGNLTEDNFKYMNGGNNPIARDPQPKTLGGGNDDFFSIPDDYQYDPSEDIMVPNDDADWIYDDETGTYRPPDKPLTIPANPNDYEINQNLINAGYIYNPQTHEYERDISKTFLSDLMRNGGESSISIIANTDTSGKNNGYIYNGDYYNPYINTNQQQYMTPEQEQQAAAQYVSNYLDTVALNHVRREMPMYQQQEYVPPTQEEMDAQYEHYRQYIQQMHYAQLQNQPEAVDHGAIMYANNFARHLSQAKELMPDDMSFADTLEVLTDLAVQNERRENKRQRFNGLYNRNSFTERLMKEMSANSGKRNQEKLNQMNQYYSNMFSKGCKNDKEYANLLKSTGEDPINEYARQKLEFMRLAALNPHDPNNKLN